MLSVQIGESDGYLGKGNSLSCACEVLLGFCSIKNLETLGSSLLLACSANGQKGSAVQELC